MNIIQTGDLLTLVNATSFSFFLVISKRLMMRIDALAGTAILLTFGALMIGILGVPPLLEVEFAALSARFWWLAVFIVLLPTAAAYVINYWALGKVDSSLVAFFIFLQPALAGLFFDSPVTESMITLPSPHDLPGTQTAIIYRIYAGDEPVAALFVVAARDGYAGPIRLLIGIKMDGTVTGVRVLQHRETPGLGDRIEITKSDWVLQFDGQSLRDPVPGLWAIKDDGGQFDQLTGASVTPRAVIKAIKETLIYFEANRDSIFMAVAGADASAAETE